MLLEKWISLPKEKQILNIASELIRAKICGEKKEKNYEHASLERVFEMLELTVADKKWSRGARREFLRFREIIGEWYIGHTQISPHQFLKVLFQFSGKTNQVEI